MKRTLLMLVLMGLVTMLLSLAMSLVYPPSVSYAQRETPTLVIPRDTPTPIRPSKDEDEEDASPPLTGGVEGFVYNYSAGGAAQPGVGVVLDGGGWRAETVTDSNGFYRFAGLGSGSATLNLKLPPGARPVMPDWPVYTNGQEGNTIDLAFYWGDLPPLPVALSVEPAAITSPADQVFGLNIKVSNQSGHRISGGVIDLKLPAALQALGATVSHGEIDFADHRIWGLLDDLPDGETATLSLEAKFDQAVFPQHVIAQAIFNYQEQLTPQLVKFDIIAAEPTGQSEARPAPLSEHEVTDQSASSTSAPAATPADQPPSFVPTTGDTLIWILPLRPSIVLSIILIIGLGVAALKALFRRV